MIIKRVNIRNFRMLKDLDVNLEDILPLVVGRITRKNILFSSLKLFYISFA
jgi:hypothetical protein